MASVGHYVYIIVPREFIKASEDVDKDVGYSTSLSTRLSSYPDVSVMLSVVRVPDGRVAEAAVVAEFRKAFSQQKKVGREYFKGGVDEMQSAFLRVALRVSAGPRGISWRDDELAFMAGGLDSVDSEADVGESKGLNEGSDVGSEGSDVGSEGHSKDEEGSVKGVVLGDGPEMAEGVDRAKGLAQEGIVDTDVLVNDHHFFCDKVYV
jgi:hypothetical protein